MQTQSILWTKLLGSTTHDIGRKVATDLNNNVYMTGYTLGDIDGNTNQGLYDLFLTKYDSDGNTQWTQMLGSISSERTYGIAIDSNNNVYISGIAESDLDGNTNQGENDVFLTKYDSDGNKQWTQMLGTTDNDYNHQMAIDSNNNVYVNGYTQGDLDGNTNQGETDAFLTKYDSDGNKQWTQMLGTTDIDESHGVATDSNNNVYITGYTRSDLDGNTNQGGYDAFLTKYDSEGAKRWTQTLGTNQRDISYGVATDSNNSIYITGYTRGDLDGNTNQGLYDSFLTKYDSEGDKKWTQMLGSNNFDHSQGVTTDSNNNIYITGYTQGDLDGNSNQGGYDAFLTKYDSEGNKQWTQTLGTIKAEVSLGVATDSNNNIYITGYAGGNLDGNTNQGGYDAFLTKYGSGLSESEPDAETMTRGECFPCVTNNDSYLYTPPVFSMRNHKKKLYSNNALIFYKSNSLPSSGAGTVRNSRAIARRT